MSETKTISSNETYAPVVTEWRKFIYRGGCALYWPIFAGVDKDGNIWLRLKNISEAVKLESCGTLNKDEFNKLASKLPDSMCRKIWHYSLALQDYRSIVAIAPNGLYEVTQALLRSDQPELAKKASRKIWNWLVHNVFPEMRGLAAKQLEAEILSLEELPDLSDEKSDIDTRPLHMVKQRTFTYADKHSIRVSIDKDDEIWLALCDIFEALNRDSANAIHSSLWTSIIEKLSNKQYKMIIFREADRFEYHRILALNISGLFAVTKALLDDSAELVNTAANKLWHWVLTEVVFPMLRLKNKQRWAEEDESEESQTATNSHMFGNSEQLPTGLEYEEVPDNEEIEAAKLVREPKRRNTVTLSEFIDVLQFNGLNIGLDMLRDYLIRCGWLDKKEHDMPTSFALNTGLFTIVRTKTIQPRAELTIKGQWYFLRLFAMLKATAFDYAYDEYLSKFGFDLENISERLERRSKKAIRARLKAAADIVTHFLNIIGIGKGAK